MKTVNHLNYTKLRKESEAVKQNLEKVAVINRPHWSLIKAVFSPVIFLKRKNKASQKLSNNQHLLQKT